MFELANLQIEHNSGIIMMLGGTQISRSDFDFVDIPYATLRRMCEEKEFPPSINIIVSSTSDGRMPNSTKMHISLTGAIERSCSNLEEPARVIELLSSDLCPPKTQSESLNL